MTARSYAFDLAGIVALSWARSPQRLQRCRGAQSFYLDIPQEFSSAQYFRRIIRRSVQQKVGVPKRSRPGGPIELPAITVEGKRPIFLPDVQQVAPPAFTPAYPAAREQAERYTEPIPREQWGSGLRAYTPAILAAWQPVRQIGYPFYPKWS